MNDKIIINTISKIHFIIVSLLSFIFLGLSVVFILLQNGIYLNNISLPNVQIKQLYIKWNENLNISAEEVKIVTRKDKNKTNIDYKLINRVFKEIVLFDNWFEKIVVNKIDFNDISAKFNYTRGKKGFLIASSPKFSFKSTIFSETDLFNIYIEEFKDFQRNIYIDGNIILDLYSSEIKISTMLNMNINNDALFKLFATADPEKLRYRVNSLKEITNIEHTIKLFNLNKAIEYWALDAINMSDLLISDIHGWIEYKKISQAYKNLYVSANVNNLLYTYNKDLDPIRSKNTLLEFQNGVLSIFPKEAYTYNHFLDKSWVKVDLSKKEELVAINLLFKGALDKGIHTITNRYGIHLPFNQNSGVLDTNLKLEINLHTIDVTAKGDFFTKKANFDYLGLNLNIFDTYISIDTNDIKIKNMLVKYSDSLDVTAKVDVDYNAKNNIGTIGFKVQDAKFKDIDLSLKHSSKPLNITYRMLKSGDIVEVEDSVWNFASNSVNVNPMNINYDSLNHTLNIPKTLVSIKNHASAYVWGTTPLKPLSANLNIDLFKLSVNGLEMTQPSARLKLLYNDKFTLMLSKAMNFSFNDIEYILAGTKVDILNNSLDVKYGYLSIKDTLETKFNGVYKFSNKKGDINLDYLKLKSEKLGEIFYNKKGTKLTLDTNKNRVSIKSKEFDLHFLSTQSDWSLKLNSLKKLSTRSKIFKDYNITDGKANVYKKDKDKKISFSANLTYPYKILVKDNIPVKDYSIKGTYGDNISLLVNNIVNVVIDENININTSNIGININDVLNFFNDRNSSSSNNNSTNLLLSADNSYLYIDKDRHIISETMSLQYFNNITTAQLKHKKGLAGLQLEDGIFHLYGENFNHEFMQNLFALSKFKNGSLSFSMDGTPAEYDGIFHIHETTILEYKVLNNILAFVNTIPSLMTFSLPGYSKEGLAVSDAYMNFHTKDDVFHITDVYLNSKELNIAGRGTASFKTNKIDLKLTLKSDLGSTVSKIPLVGYILLGDDTISTTLKITGPLDDPKIETLIAEDIIVAPLNIIKRTFLLPYHLITGE